MTTPPRSTAAARALRRQALAGCVALLVPGVVACSPVPRSVTHSVAPSPVPRPVRSAVAEDQGAPQREVREIAVERRYLRHDVDRAAMVYEPGSDRQQASYEHYIFGQDAWRALVADVDPAWTTLRVRVEVLDVETTRSTPPPSMPSPEGGFRHVQISCRPVQLVTEP